MRLRHKLCRQLPLWAVGLCAISLLAERATFSQEPLQAPGALPAPGANLQPQAPDNESQPALTDDQPALADGNEEFVVLESGPVHEAFAEPITLNAEPDIVVPKQPPEPVSELPPETRPQGDNIVWAPGYWAWTEEENDFIWISGAWRDVPPGQEWVPGYWSEVDGGYRWTHGFWSAQSPGEMAYLPPPPESLESGPPSPQPGDDYFYIPGCWRWQDSRYAWRPGFWHPAAANWVWMPAHYCWTPRGYLYLDGYWDYPLVQRGFLFAPVRFRRPIYLTAGYRYTPYYWINLNRLTVGLFVAPRRGSYFFGSYYGPRYASAGYYPWYQYHNRRFGYDPLFVYESRRHGHDDGGRWLANLSNDYQRYGHRGPDDRVGNNPNVFGRDHDGDRPGRGGHDGDHDHGPRLVQNLSELKGDRVTRIDDQQRRQVVDQQVSRMQDIRRQRSEIESHGPRADFSGRDRSGRGQPSNGVTPGRSNQDGPQNGQFDRNRADRSDRSGNLPFANGRQTDPSLLQQRQDQTRHDQPRADQPRANQPRADQPRTTTPGNNPFRGRSDSGRSAPIQRSQPQLQQPSGRRGNAFQFQPRQQQSSPQSTRRPSGNSPNFGGRSTPPQSRGNFQNSPRSNGFNAGPSGRSGGTPSFRSPSSHGGGGSSRGGGGPKGHGGNSGGGHGGHRGR